MAAEGIAVRFNTRARRAEYADYGTPHHSNRWTPFDDRWVARLFRTIEDTRQIVDGRGRQRNPSWSEGRRKTDLLSIVAKTEVDPFAEWLNALEPWDGVERLGALMSQCFSADDTMDGAYLAHCSASVPVSICWRTFEPGTKHDETVVLVGPQGIGKDTYWAHLFPPEHSFDWHTDGFVFSDTHKTMIEATLGRVLVSVSEMRGTTRVAVESIKQYLTQTVDNSTRLAYAHYPETMPRMFVFVGTSNDQQCLPNDPTGNRRFLPVLVSGRLSYAAMVAHLDSVRRQVWAEALAAYRAGTTAVLPEAVRPEAERLTDIMAASDSAAEEALLDAISAEMMPWRNSWVVSPTSLVKYCRDRHGVDRSSKAWAAMLSGIGATNRGAQVVGTRRIRVWELPAAMHPEAAPAPAPAPDPEGLF